MGSRHRSHTDAEQAELGARVRQARQKAGLTQVEVGQQLGQSQSLIAKIERGERQVTALELRDLARIFNVPVSELFDDLNR